MRRSSQGNSNSYKFDFHNGNATTKLPHNHHKILTCYTKPRPSKWDDAQKWLSRAPDDRRSSNADDRRLLPSLSQKGRHSCSNADGAFEHDMPVAAAAASTSTSSSAQDEGETKRVDSMETYRCVSLRDMGTEMTPNGSKEPSRASTPRVAPTAAPVASPLSSWLPASPGQCVSRLQGQVDDDAEICKSKGLQKVADMRLAVSPATAWDEAERAKYMARYKREEVKIQAWENHEKRKAEMEMKMIEVKAERMKSRAQEKMARKMASTQMVAKEKRAHAEAKLTERSARTSDRAEYLRRRGHLPCSFFSLKLPLLCS